MFQRRSRRFRRRSNGRNHKLRSDGDRQIRLGSNSFSNGQIRNNFRTTLSPEKLFEKYSALAKEALSSGDKTLSENYLQHADHFMRIIKNRTVNQEKAQNIDKNLTTDTSDSKDSTIQEKKE